MTRTQDHHQQAKSNTQALAACRDGRQPPSPATGSPNAYVTAGATYLGIFASTTQRDISQLPLSVDPEMVAAQQPAAFAISQDLFLVNVVQPLLPGPLGGSSSSYTYDPASHAIRVTKTVTMSGITEGLITYYPEIDTLCIH